MDITELRKKSEGELQQLLKQQRETVRDLRFKVTAKQHKDVRELREAKKAVARILTTLKEKRVLQAYTEKQSAKQPTK